MDSNFKERKILGLTGKMQSGKDTLGWHLTEDRGYVRMAFADRIKKGLAEILGVSTAHIDSCKVKGEEHPILGMPYRKMLQTLGTEWGRDIVNPDIWVLLLKEEIQMCTRPIVVTDVRFANEAKMIKVLGGAIININRPGCDGDDHVSENSLPDIYHDYTLDNNSTVEHLFEQFDKLETQLLGE